MVSATSLIGTLGERAATKWLRCNGFLIHDLNWRMGRYELDIVAERLGVIHIIEVKSRKLGGLTTPEEAMTKKKFNAFVIAARAYVAQHNIRQELQFDLIAVDVMDNNELRVRFVERVMEFKW